MSFWWWLLVLLGAVLYAAFFGWVRTHRDHVETQEVRDIWGGETGWGGPDS